MPRVISGGEEIKDEGISDVEHDRNPYDGEKCREQVFRFTDEELALRDVNIDVYVHVQPAFDLEPRKAPGTSTSLYSSEHDPSTNYELLYRLSRTMTHLSPQRDHQDPTILHN